MNSAGHSDFFGFKDEREMVTASYTIGVVADPKDKGGNGDETVDEGDGSGAFHLCSGDVHKNSQPVSLLSIPYCDADDFLI